MANRPPSPDIGDGTGMGRDHGPTTGTSRWQKVVGIIGLVVVLGVGIKIFGGGGGPGGHDPGGNTPPAVTEDGDQPLPSGGGGPHDPSNWGH
jgi:hypothetical protein